MTINDLAVKHHEWIERMGWHNKTPLEMLALVTSEVGEAVNECRGITSTEHLGAELADIILRVLDMAIECHIDLERALFDKMEINNRKGTLGRVK